MASRIKIHISREKKFLHSLCPIVNEKIKRIRVQGEEID